MSMKRFSTMSEWSLQINVKQQRKKVQKYFVLPRSLSLTKPFLIPKIHHDLSFIDFALIVRRLFENLPLYISEDT